MSPKSADWIARTHLVRTMSSNKLTVAQGIAQLETSIAAVRQTRIRYGGDEGAFVSKRVLRDLASELEDLRASAGAEREEFSTLQNELTRLEASAGSGASVMRKMQADLDALRAERSKLEHRTAEAKRLADQAVADAAEERARLVADNDRILKERRELREKLDSLQRNAEGPEDLAGPSAAMEVLRSELAANNAKLEALSVANKQLKKEKTGWTTEAAEFKRKVDDLQARLADARSARMNAGFVSDGKPEQVAPVTPEQVVIEAPAFVIKLLGANGAAYLARAKALSVNSVRERAFKTIQALSSPQASAHVHGIKAILLLAMDFLKHASLTKALVLRDWLAGLIQDLWSGSLKSAKAYRVTLEAALDVARDRASAASRHAKKTYEKAKASGSWTEWFRTLVDGGFWAPVAAVWREAKAVASGVSRALSSASERLGRLAGGVVSWVSRSWSSQTKMQKAKARSYAQVTVEEAAEFEDETAFEPIVLFDNTNARFKPGESSGGSH